MNEINNICRICKKTGSTVVIERIPTGFGASFAITRCKSCTFLSTYPLPSDEMLNRMYGEYYWNTEKRERVHSLDGRFFELRMKGLLRILERSVPKGGRILDWGAGDGAWTAMLNKAGFQATGVDKYSSETESETMIRGDIKTADLPDAYFDALTSFHVLEHLPDPVESLDAAIKKLKPGGIMILEVPNAESPEFKIFGKRWHPLDIPFHLNHFGPTVMGRIFSEFKDVEIIRTDYFSLRFSPASLVVSLASVLDPRRVRAAFKGRFPLWLKPIYLALQAAALPLCWFLGTLKAGNVLRITLKRRPDTA